MKDEVSKLLNAVLHEVQVAKRNDISNPTLSLAAIRRLQRLAIESEQEYVKELRVRGHDHVAADVVPVSHKPPWD